MPLLKLNQTSQPLRSSKGGLKRRNLLSDSSSLSTNSQMEKMAKMLDSSNIRNVKAERSRTSHQPKEKDPTNTFSPRNPNAFPYRRNNPQTQILQRDRNSNEDQRIKVPLKNVVMDEGPVAKSQEDELKATFIVLEMRQGHLISHNKIMSNH